MIIGIDASRANTDHRTGTEWYSYFVIQELKKIIPAEHTVRLYSKEPLKSDLLPLPANWENRVLGWKPGKFWTQLRLSIEMILHRPDVLYVPAHTIPIVSPKKTVTVIHDVGFIEAPELYSQSELSYHNWSFRLAIKKAAHIITISNFSYNAIANIAPEIVSHLTRIYNGLHVRGGEADTRILERFALQGKTILLTISRVEEKKNSHRVVEAFAQYKNTHPGDDVVLVFAGGFGFGAEALRQFVKDRGLEKSVIFTDYVSDNEIVALLQAARAFVFPSLYEGFGMPVLEAMRYDVPVICSDIPSLREVAGDAAVFFNPKSTDAIAEAIERELSHPEKSQEKIAAGHKQAESFSWQKTANETWDIIKSVSV